MENLAQSIDIQQITKDRTIFSNVVVATSPVNVCKNVTAKTMYVNYSTK
jgi:hypothetical protein